MKTKFTPYMRLTLLIIVCLITSSYLTKESVNSNIYGKAMFASERKKDTIMVMSKETFDALHILSWNSLKFWCIYYKLEYNYVMGIARRESNLKSSLASNYNNLFGMMYPRIRPTTAKPIEGSVYARYESFIEAVEDMHLYDKHIGIRFAHENKFYGEDSLAMVLKYLPPKTSIKIDTFKIGNKIRIQVKL